MSATRPRRIVGRAVMVLAVVVLLPVWYIATGVSLAFIDGAGWLPSWLRDAIVPIYAPVNWYITCRYPGADFLASLPEIAGQAGARMAGR